MFRIDQSAEQSTNLERFLSDNVDVSKHLALRELKFAQGFCASSGFVVGIAMRAVSCNFSATLIPLSVSNHRQTAIAAAGDFVRRVDYAASFQRDLVPTLPGDDRRR